MRDHPENSCIPRKAPSALVRISETLGIPVAAFYGSDADPEAVDRLHVEQEAKVLELVRAHLRRIDPEAGRRFVEAVQAMAKAEAH